MTIARKRLCMRDPERIDELLHLIKANWMQDSDMRFMQLLYILQSEIAREDGEIWTVKEKVEHDHSRIGFDMFNFEDVELITFLKKRAQSNISTEI